MNMTSEAHHNGIKTLYRFMAYPRDGSDRSKQLRLRVNALITAGELYFARGGQLNDPFDASPHFKIPETPHELIRQLWEIYGPKWGWSEDQIRAKEADLLEGYRSGALRVHLAGVAEKWRNNFRIWPMCCFSATRESILMWSYYAAGHSGVCIHFDASMAPFGNAQRVIYSPDYPTLPLPLGDIENTELVTASFLTKSLAWAHEEEYRVINYQTSYEPEGEAHILDDVFRWKDAQTALIPARAIAGVTIGANMYDAEIESILRLCHDRRPRVPVYLAKCRPDQFALAFEAIS